jgi:hypothetical protein
VGIGTQRREAIRDFSVDCALLDPAPTSEGAAGRVLIVDDDAAVRLVCL